jgi:hypothetical protein
MQLFELQPLVELASNSQFENCLPSRAIKASWYFVEL